MTVAVAATGRVVPTAALAAHGCGSSDVISTRGSGSCGSCPRRLSRERLLDRERHTAERVLEEYEFGSGRVQ